MKKNWPPYTNSYSVGRKKDEKVQWYAKRVSKGTIRRKRRREKRVGKTLLLAYASALEYMNGRRRIMGLKDREKGRKS